MKKKTDRELEKEILEFSKTKDKAYERQSAARKAHREDPANAHRLAAVRLRMSLSKALYDIRKAAGMTQKQIAEKMNTNQAYIAKLERGQLNTTVDTLERYAEACGKQISISMI